MLAGVALIASAGLRAPAPAIAWGDDAHKIICRIAYDALGPDDRHEVRRLALAYERPDGTSFASFPVTCVFADEARRNARAYDEASARGDDRTAARLKPWARFGAFVNWHFLNVARADPRVRRGACHDDCVLTAIDRHRARFADRSLDDQRRAEALFLLAHWIGDVHQPLHVSYADDLGGNHIDEIRGGFYSEPNLHAVWDSGIVRHAREHLDWRLYAAKLEDGITAADRAAWRASTPLEWANESYALARSTALDYCRLHDDTCESTGNRRFIGAPYQARCQPIVEKRLQQAGVRLAAVITASLHPTH